MVLRNCIEILRENQKQAANKVRFYLLMLALLKVNWPHAPDHFCIFERVISYTP